MIKKNKNQSHKTIGYECNLFYIDEVAPGEVFWNNNGWILFNTLIKYIQGKYKNNEYLEISTPTLVKNKLWIKSGHWDKFKENIFSINKGNNKQYIIKPMNCLGASNFFHKKLISYKHLPLRLSEFGKVYRYESSGSLDNLMRLKSFTQDDGHIFCKYSQVIDESKKILKQIILIYNELNFIKIKIKISKRPKKSIGSKSIWCKAELILKKIIEKEKLKYTIDKDGGAFYGPKIEFILMDNKDREWQLGTIQLDFNIPRKLNIKYIEKNGKKYNTVILHRAIFGSLERFIGVLIEHCNGYFPLWIAPIQVSILNINEKSVKYSYKIYKKMKNIPVKSIYKNIEKRNINKKIKKCYKLKIPILIIIGINEYINNTISIINIKENKKKRIEFNYFKNKMIKNIILIKE